MGCLSVIFRQGIQQSRPPRAVGGAGGGRARAVKGEREGDDCYCSPTVSCTQGSQKEEQGLFRVVFGEEKGKGAAACHETTVAPSF